MRQPLLAPLEDPMKRPTFFQDLPFPQLVSPKFDGLRGLNRRGTVLSKTMKPLRSLQVQREFGKLWSTDGELIAGEPTWEGCCARTESTVMSANKPHKDLRYYLFDYIRDDHLDEMFIDRYKRTEDLFEKWRSKIPGLRIVPQILVEDVEHLLDVEAKLLGEGYEGLMMRTPWGVYKHTARATWNDAIIYKLKRFTDEEAVVIGFEEAQSNLNEAEEDERGYVKRSKAGKNKSALARVGKFICDYNGKRMKVSPGAFTTEELEEIWATQEMHIGKFLKFRYFNYGIKDMPRFPRAVMFRNPDDMWMEDEK